MRKIALYFLLVLIQFVPQDLSAQDDMAKSKIQILENLKIQVAEQEKEALKLEVEKINKQQKNNNITIEQAKTLKEDLAIKRAKNIENRLAILTNKIELLNRNGNQVLELDTLNYLTAIELDWGNKRDDGERLFGVRILKNTNRSSEKYDRRTYLDPVFAVGLNNSVVDGQSLEDSPYKLGGSRFVELGWAWRTRVFKNSNALRFSYGVSFQFNGLKPKNNEYFIVNNGQTELQEFEVELRKSKFRMDNLVFPLHFEFGPSTFTKSEDKVRYSIRNKFRIGIGGYGGLNIGSRQKLKYSRDGKNVKDKLKGGYNTSSFVYGLSAYVGFDGVQLYAKYDLNPIFKDALVEQRNVSLGFRFDLD